MRLSHVLVALVLLLAAAAAGAATPRYDLDVRVDLESRSLVGRGTLTLPAGEAVDLVMRADFIAERIALAGRDVPLERRERDGVQRWRVPAARQTRHVELEWRGTLAPLDAAISHRQTLGATQPVAMPPARADLSSAAASGLRSAGAAAAHRHRPATRPAAATRRRTRENVRCAIMGQGGRRIQAVLTAGAAAWRGRRCS